MQPAIRLVTSPPAPSLPPGRGVPRASHLVAVARERHDVAYAKRRPNWMAIAAIVAVHAGVIGVLLTQAPPFRFAKPPAAIVVELVRPAEPPKPPPPPPKQKPLPVKTLAPIPFVPPPPVIVPDVPRVQDLPTITLPPPPPEPVVQPAILAPVAPVAAAPAIAPLVPPRFDAAYLDNPAPVYPSIARRQHEEGRVLLRVFVTAEGTAGTVEVAKSSGSERLDRAALEAVRRWKFVPARRGDQAVAAHVNVPIVFTLDPR